MFMDLFKFFYILEKYLLVIAGYSYLFVKKEGKTHIQLHLLFSIYTKPYHLDMSKSIIMIMVEHEERHVRNS